MNLLNSWEALTNLDVTFILALNPENKNKTTLLEFFFLPYKLSETVFCKIYYTTPKDQNISFHIKSH